jgi:serine/threonine protein phosphatase 1
MILKVTTPLGRQIGVVHADIPTNDWNDIERTDWENIPPYEMQMWENSCLWDRMRFQNPTLDGVANIDHVYFGHSIVRSVKRMANCSWIDTGAYHTGVLTALELK